MASKEKYTPGNHPDLPPPISTSGVIGWMRINLFSSLSNVVLTILGIALLYVIIPPIFEWAIFNSVWNVASRTECWAEMTSPNAGACWSFIQKRFIILVYGFYPEPERWRVNIAFILLILAVIPVLFDQVPGRKYGFWYAAAYPFIAGWLLVGGGSYGFWFFIFLIGTTFLANALFQRFVKKDGNVFKKLMLFVFIISILFWIPALAQDFSEIFSFGFTPVDTDQFGGMMLTLVIGITGVSFSLPIGVVLALGRTSNMPAVRMLCTIFIEFIRGVPLITLLFIASTMLNYFLPPGTQFDLLVRVLIMVTLFAAAYNAEVIRGGLQGVARGQFEAADAMGLKYWQSMRLIVLPQALKISIPGIVNNFIGLFKDSVLVLIIGMFDILGLGQASLADAKWAGLANEMYLFCALFFFICCFSMSRYSLYLEKKLHTGL